MLKRISCAVFLVLAVTSVLAQQLTVATGAKGGTYATMFAQLQKVCGRSIALVETPSTGSVQNMEALVGNTVNAAFLQTDVIYLRAKTDNLGHLKTLLALHPEEIHLVAKAGVRREGGVSVSGFNVGGKDVTLSTLGDLHGRKVGAAGGSFVTARVVQLLSEVRFELVELGSPAEVLKAVQSGQIDAGLLVGGAPLPILAQSSGLKLLSITGQAATNMKSVYVPAKVSYSNMKSMGVDTMATEALLVTRDYKTPTYVNALASLRSCFYAQLDELREGAGNHPKWSDVRPENRGKWVWYELPTIKRVQL